MILQNFDTKNVKLPTKIVPTPALGENAEIIVRKMNIGDTIIFNALVSKHAVDGMIASDVNMAAKLIASMVNDEGEHIAKPDQLDYIVKKLDKDTFLSLYDAYYELNESFESSEKEFKEKKSKS